MVMVLVYDSRGDTPWSVDLGSEVVRLGSITGLTMKAQHCQVGGSSITFDNPDGTVGHSGDSILGLQWFRWFEDDGSQQYLIYQGLIGTREYGRRQNSSLITGVANEIVAQLSDSNALLSLQAIPKSDTDANRAAETVGDRLTWLLGSDYLDGIVADNGLVTYPSTMMTAADYRLQRPVNVINDCELAGRYYAFVYTDDTANPFASLFFDNANTSEAFTSTLFLTNDLSLVDNIYVFAVEPDTKLRRDPTDVGDEVLLPYRSGTAHRTLAATADTYGHKTLIAPNSNVKSSTKADDEADDFLEEHATEEDTIIGTVKIPASRVHLIQAGMRIGVLFTNLPGYESWCWTRITQLSPGQRELTSEFYTLPFELSPQEGFSGDPPDPPAPPPVPVPLTGSWVETLNDPPTSAWSPFNVDGTASFASFSAPSVQLELVATKTQEDAPVAGMGGSEYATLDQADVDADAFQFNFGFVGTVDTDDVTFDGTPWFENITATWTPLSVRFGTPAATPWAQYAIGFQIQKNANSLVDSGAWVYELVISVAGAYDLGAGVHNEIDGSTTFTPVVVATIPDITSLAGQIQIDRSVARGTVRFTYGAMQWEYPITADIGAVGTDVVLFAGIDFFRTSSNLHTAVAYNVSDMVQTLSFGTRIP